LPILFDQSLPKSTAPVPALLRRSFCNAPKTKNPVRCKRTGPYFHRRDEKINCVDLIWGELQINQILVLRVEHFYFSFLQASLTTLQNKNPHPFYGKGFD